MLTPKELHELLHGHRKGSFVYTVFLRHEKAGIWSEHKLAMFVEDHVAGKDQAKEIVLSTLAKPEQWEVKAVTARKLTKP